MGFYKSFIFPVLRKFDPEKIHYFSTTLLKLICRIPFIKNVLTSQFTIEDAKLHVRLFGLDYPNPVGLAAGFDKNARWIDELATLGFGFIEIGTLTPKAQSGNPKPRLFRLMPDKAIINRMGFNNEGSLTAAQLLKVRRSKIIVGGNIGKNKLTPNEEAVNDYIIAFNDLYEYVDYFVVNVSSPNTPGLRELQEKEPLTHILKTLKAVNREKRKEKPILLKIAPDLTENQLDDIVEITFATEIDGLIATNTTISRLGLETSPDDLEKIGAGGLSGIPLRNQSTEVIRYLSNKSGGQFPIIGVGGIYSAADAIEKLEAGASLIQVYSGFIYEGPALAKEICEGILAHKSNKNHSKA